MVAVSTSSSDAKSRFERISSRLSDRGTASFFRMSSLFASSCRVSKVYRPGDCLRKHGTNDKLKEVV